MKGVIMSFRRSKHVQYNNQMIIKIDEIDSKEKAIQLIGKTVVWKSPAGNVIKGKITFPHGRKGSTRALFEKGMPGQSLCTAIEIM